MSEPTREQIKEAFKKTIERWEKIVGRPTYYHESHCSLCRMKDGTDTCHKFCPIRDYGMADEHRVCSGTPYHMFTQDKTSENALAELNFLRKVYIWWMEKEEGVKLVDYLRKEKKEEWVDVTKNIVAKLYFHSDGTAVVRLYDGPYRFGYMEGNAMICSEDEKKYKPETQLKYDSYIDFRILKKT